MFKKENIPNILTLLRILIIPIIIIFLEIDTKFYSWFALILYIIACLSDFLDGYLARKFELESSFGRFLDPVADKILVVSVIFILISNGIFWKHKILIRYRKENIDETFKYETEYEPNIIWTKYVISEIKLTWKYHKNSKQNCENQIYTVNHHIKC